jgi:hypothetical protein
MVPPLACRKEIAGHMGASNYTSSIAVASGEKMTHDSVSTNSLYVSIGTERRCKRRYLVVIGCNARIR